MGERKRVALITGGTSGIGLATAIRFAKVGDAIAICGRTTKRLNAAATQIRSAVPDSRPLEIQIDFDQPEQATLAATACRDHFGRIDVLINSAAYAVLSPFDSLSKEDFERTINVNIRSTFYLIQAVWKSMVSTGGGTIISLSSLAAVDPFTGFSAYGSSKAWLDLLTIALADEGRAHNIRAFSVRPGAVNTPMLHDLFPNFPADQMVQPEEVADAILALCHPRATTPSGEAIVVSHQVPR